MERRTLIDTAFRATTVGALLAATHMPWLVRSAHAQENTPFSTTELFAQMNEVRVNEAQLPAYKVAVNGEEAEQRLTGILIDRIASGRLAAACASQGGEFSGDKIGLSGFVGEAYTCPNTKKGTLTTTDENGNVISVVETDPGQAWATEKDVVDSWRAPAVADILFRNPEADTLVCSVVNFADSVSMTQRVALCAVYDTEGQ